MGVLARGPHVICRTLLESQVSQKEDEVGSLLVSVSRHEMERNGGEYSYGTSELC